MKYFFSEIYILVQNRILIGKIKEVEKIFPHTKNRYKKRTEQLSSFSIECTPKERKSMKPLISLTFLT